MKTLILYQTKTGATKQYATWIQESIPQSELFTYDECDQADLSGYDRIIFCMPTYGGVITPKDFIESLWPSLRDKQVFLLVVGNVPADALWSKKSLNKLSEEVRLGIKGYIKLPGVVSEDADKEPSFAEKLLSKFVLKVRLEDMHRQTSVRREDLEEFLAVLND